MEKFRCRWCEGNDDLIDYHDHIWGHQRSTDEQLFEALTLEIFQAGLSWAIVYRKREGFRHAFADYDIETVAHFTEADEARLKQDVGIVRHEKKIAATIYNAQQLLHIQQRYGSFQAFLNMLAPSEYVEQLRKLFKHVGPSTAQSFLMACGYLAPEHEKRCYLYTPPNNIDNSE